MRFISSPGTKQRLLQGIEPKWLVNHPRKRYCIAAILSVPPWAKRAMFRPLYDEAKRKTRETGKAHVVDHIVPLCHPYVRGLTVPWNLQVITKIANDLKKNRWSPDQIEFDLIVVPEQLTFFATVV